MEIDRIRVTPLDDLNDYKVADGDPDVRGWEVLGADGHRIGEVDDLLVDTLEMKVRYLDVELDNENLEGSTDRHVLIPIGSARLDEEEDQVFVDTMNATSIARIPGYAHEPLTRDYETELRTHFDRGYIASAATATDFYAHDLYDQELFYRGRRGLGRETLDDGLQHTRGAHQEFGEFGRDVEGDGVSPEEDLDNVRGI